MRRVYYVIPDVPHARRVVDELQAAGIERGQMHACSKAGRQVPGLPDATEAQGRDRVGALEKPLWNADLTLFGLAAVGLMLAATAGSVGWMLGALGVMLGAYVFGRLVRHQGPSRPFVRHARAIGTWGSRADGRRSEGKGQGNRPACRMSSSGSRCRRRRRMDQSDPRHLTDSGYLPGHPISAWRKHTWLSAQRQIL